MALLPSFFAFTALGAEPQPLGPALRKREGKQVTINRTVMNLLTIVAIVLIVLWLVGYIGFGEAVGNFIHVLLVLAIIAILVRVIQGRRVI